jgi:hypothetical protein
VRWEALDQRGEVVAGEVPVEGLGDLVPVVFKGVERASEVCEVLGVVGFEQLALDDREVDLDLDVPIDVKCGGGVVCWWRLLWSGWCRSVRRRS